MSTGYEFKPQENELIGGLAGKMSFVGLFQVVIGVLYLLSAVLALTFIFQDKLPADVLSKIPDDVKGRVPNPQFLWGIVIQLAAAGLIMLMVGVWTRSAAASFQNIVATTGRDVSHLMTALGSLYKMYTLIYTLIVVMLLTSLIGLGVQLFLKYGR
jgi:hypothetical protein